MNLPPNDALHPFHLDMPRPSGMTACAGTEMTQDFSKREVSLSPLFRAFQQNAFSRCGIAGSDVRPLTKILDCCHQRCWDRSQFPPGEPHFRAR